MIIFKNNKLEVEEPENTTLNGVCYAVVINTQFINESTCLCYVYVPEIHGLYDHIFSNAFNFPRVEIPIKQDNDDPGYTPQTGDIVKVSFDDGNTNSCRFLMLIPINKNVQLNNKDYIELGILPSEIIPDITDPNILNMIRNWLNDMYYVTLGITDATELKPEHFNMNYNLSNIGFYNSFIEALNIPIASFGTNWALSTVPIYATDLFVMYDVAKKLQEEASEEELLNIFNHPPLRGDGEHKENWYDPEDYKDVSNEIKTKFVTSHIAGAESFYATIVYPDLNENDMPMQFAPFENITWWLGNQNQQSYLGQLLLKYKHLIENEWISAMASYMTGINNIVFDQNDTKYKQVILFCLTLCPWMVSVILRYNSMEFSIMQTILNSEILNDYEDVLDQIFGNAGIINRGYSVLFDESNYTTVANNVIEAIHSYSNKPKEFVDIFKGQAYSAFSSMTEILDRYSGQYLSPADSWRKAGLTTKFNRLYEIVDKLYS